MKLTALLTFTFVLLGGTVAEAQLKAGTVCITTKPTAVILPANEYRPRDAGWLLPPGTEFVVTGRSDVNEDNVPVVQGLSKKPLPAMEWNDRTNEWFFTGRMYTPVGWAKYNHLSCY